MKSSISSQLLSEFSKLVASRMGLRFPKERWPDLVRGAEAAAREFGFPDVDSCLHWLLNRPLEKADIEILASHLTIGETYFFRDEKQFEILERHVFPELIRARSAATQLRIWCAGCATGEEPYSVAIMLHRLIPGMSNWNVTILATDINPHFLRHAQKGIYREWSFRNTPPWVRERYFLKRKVGLFEVLPEIKETVTFSYDNLAEDSHPSSQRRTEAMDLILCRNVLMYLIPSQARRIADRFWQSLTEKGWLAVSPSEISQDLFSQWVPVNFPGTMLYQKDSRTSLRSAVFPEICGARPPIPVYPDADDIGSRISFVKLPAEPSLITTEEQTAPARDVTSFSVLARTYANKGQLAEALEECAKAIAADKLNPALYYLHATILEERGQVEEAVAALKRALYLNDNFVLAHFALGNLMVRQGRLDKSSKHFRNVLALLNGYRPEEIVPESDGMNAGTLVEIVKRQAARSLEKGL